MDNKVYNCMSIHLIPFPARHVVTHVLHTVGPSGSNGTQQFPKLTDWELVCIMKPMIEEKILKVFGTKQSKEENAQNMLVNLKKIAKCAKGILCQIECDHGYCSCECLRALMHNQTTQGKADDIVFQALLICFSFADLQIRLDKTRKRNAVTVVDPSHTIYHHNALNPDHDAHEKASKILDELDELKKKADKLQEALHKLLPS